MGRHREGVLDYHPDDNHRRRNPVVYLRTTHMVLVLPDGYYLKLGGSEEGTAAQAVHEHPRTEFLPNEMQELRPCLPDATHALRFSWRRNRIFASRLPEVRQVRTGLPYEDYDSETLRLFSLPELSRINAFHPVEETGEGGGLGEVEAVCYLGNAEGGLAQEEGGFHQEQLVDVAGDGTTS